MSEIVASSVGGTMTTDKLHQFVTTVKNNNRIDQNGKNSALVKILIDGKLYPIERAYVNACGEIIIQAHEE